jgi:hypothetical protein
MDGEILGTSPGAFEVAGEQVPSVRSGPAPGETRLGTASPAAAAGSAAMIMSTP